MSKLDELRNFVGEPKKFDLKGAYVIDPGYSKFVVSEAGGSEARIKLEGQIVDGVIFDPNDCAKAAEFFDLLGKALKKLKEQG